MQLSLSYIQKWVILIEKIDPKKGMLNISHYILIKLHLPLSIIYIKLFYQTDAITLNNQEKKSFNT